MTLWDLLFDNWQYACSVILLFALGYLYAYRNAREHIRDLEHENDKLKWDNHILRKLLRNREGE